MLPPFKKFPLGQISNAPEALGILPGVNARPTCSRVLVRHPARLEPIVLDFTRLVAPLRPWVCTAGAVAIAVDLYTTVEVRVLQESDDIVVRPGVSRGSVVRHCVSLLRQAIGFSQGLEIDVRASIPAHAGLGSTAGIYGGVGHALNCLFGKPLPDHLLVRYLAQNYGEEISGDDQNLVWVPSTGGAVGVGLLGGGMAMFAGEATQIARVPLPAQICFIIGLFESRPERHALEEYGSSEQIRRTLELGSEMSKEVAYEILHSFLPAMMSSDWKTLGKVVWNVRCNESNLARLELAYPGLKSALLSLKTRLAQLPVPLLSVSSSGPAVFAWTELSAAEEVSQCFKALGMRPLRVMPDNMGTTIESFMS